MIAYFTMADSNKRPASEDENEDETEEWIGPMPTEAAKPKKRKVLAYEQVYVDNLPSSPSYEKSFMHRDIITHLVVTKTDFIVTASTDGHIKFWKKSEDAGIDFVKHFRSHLGTIIDLSASINGGLICSVSDDKTIKVFDVLSFDMINMIKLPYTPQCSCWVYSPGDAITAVALAEKGANTIYIYDSQGTGEPIYTLDKLHYHPVTLIVYNSVFETAVSIDTSGMLEYWSSPRHDCNFPTKSVSWEYKTETDLYDLAKAKTVATGLAFSPNGKLMAAICKDRKIRVFKFLTGKLSKVLDESLQQFSELQQMKQQLPNMEFGRRMAVERDLAKADALKYCNIVFDESGNFILYPTMLGIKVINLTTNRCLQMIGKPENVRFLHIALFQGSSKKSTAAVTMEIEASDNPTLLAAHDDPTMFCTAFKKNRFYLFTRRNPHEGAGDVDRDVFNEKPSKEELVSATQDSSYSRVADSATLHTSMGDIHVKLYHKECPKSVENFCVHSRNGYFNGHIFHRVIKSFMVQTGDPLGNGTGGESIWGAEFEDEFHPSLKHDRPYTFSMANAGPNTNGSQFFITVAPTPWLDNKHTVFGRAVKGMEVIQNISNMKTNPKTDKPHDDIRIISVTVK